MADLLALQGLNTTGLPTLAQTNITGVRPPVVNPGTGVATSQLGSLANQLSAAGVSLPGAGTAPAAAPTAGPAPISTAGMDWSQVSPQQFSQLKQYDPTTFGAPQASQGVAPPIITTPTRNTGGGDGGGSTGFSPTAAAAPSAPAGDPSLAARNGFPNNVEVIRGGQVMPNTSAWSATPGGVPGGFVDPRAAIATGYQMQEAYRQQGLHDIMEAARQGDPNNYSFRVARLVDAIGPNNFGAIQGQGTNSLNSALAGIQSAGIGAGASIYGSDQATARNAADIAQQNTAITARPVPSGTTLARDQATGLSMPVTTYSVPARNSEGGFSFNPIGPEAQRQQAAKPVVGKTYVDKAGNRAVYQQDGSYKPE